MKKSLKLMSAALIALASFVPAMADVTVFDGTDVSSEIPISSRFMDWAVYTHQVIYPAAELTAMEGKEVTAIKYYLDNACTLNAGNVSLYIATTDQPKFIASYNGSTSFVETEMTLVSAMAMQTGVNEIEFVFTEPWTYNGGNILIQTVIDEDGQVVGTTATNFLGQESEGAAAAGMYTINVYNFGPKTTFVCEGGVTPEPEFIRGDVDGNEVVGIADVTSLVDYILGGDDSEIDLRAADCDENGIIGIADVTALVDFILNGAWE